MEEHFFVGYPNTFLVFHLRENMKASSLSVSSSQFLSPPAMHLSAVLTDCLLQLKSCHPLPHFLLFLFSELLFVPLPPFASLPLF